MGAVETLVEDKLYALINPYVLDGRAGSHPVDVRGFTTMNCYLLTEGDRALLWSTGYSVHQESLLRQLDGLVGDRTLSLAIPRTEYAAMCNARPIADRFPVAEVYYHVNFLPSAMLNFRPEFAANGHDGLRDAQLIDTHNGTVASLGAPEAGRLKFLKSRLLLMPSYWAYDRDTRTLFTGDMFTWTTREGPTGPWVLESEDDDSTTQDDVEHFLFRNRYWWLPGANTAPLRTWLKRLFEEYDIEVVAPDHGCVLRGSALAASVQYLDRALEVAATMPEVGTTAGAWSLKGATAR